MAEKLIRLPQLQRFKQNADAAYQGKLTAGDNVTISGNTISADVTFGQQTLYNATITVAGWSGTSNTVAVQGLTAGDDVEVVGVNPTGLTDQQINAAKNALYLITYGTTSTNAITFYALNGLPSVDIPVTVRKLIDTNVTTRDYSAGEGVTLNNGVISTISDFSSAVISGSETIANNTVVKLGDYLFSPGKYLVWYTCTFDQNSTGYRQCGFSSSMNLDGFGSAFFDTQYAVNGAATQTQVFAPLNVSESSYPNGRTFNFLAKQTSGSSLRVVPRCYYVKIS